MGQRPQLGGTSMPSRSRCTSCPGTLLNSLRSLAAALVATATEHGFVLIAMPSESDLLGHAGVASTAPGRQSGRQYVALGKEVFDHRLRPRQRLRRSCVATSWVGNPRRHSGNALFTRLFGFARRDRGRGVGGSGRADRGICAHLIKAPRQAVALDRRQIDTSDLGSAIRSPRRGVMASAIRCRTKHRRTARGA